MGFFDLFSPSPGVDTVTAEELKEKIKKERPLLLDVREPHEHNQRNIPGSILIPLGQLTSRLSELDKYKEKAIVIYCASGSRSANACRLLKSKGFNVINLSGGMNRWR